MKTLTLLFSLFISFHLIGDIKAPKQPNVLFIIADDLNTSLSGFGHEQCKTPELDKLAKEGVKFENMHCQYPVCGSSRASIMSGLYPYSNFTLSNDGTLRGNMPDVITMSQIFKNKGYYTARVSKIYHMGIPSEIVKGTAKSDDPLSWNEVYNIKAPEQHAPGIKTNWSPKNTGGQSFTGVIATTNDSDHADGMAADKAIQLLEQHRDKPFFLAVGFVRPHVPLVAPKKYFDQYNRENMKPPYVPSNDLDDIPEAIRTFKSNHRSYGVTPEGHKGLLQAYYASVSYMDAQVGRVLDKLEDLGLKENTIVVFTSDHGYLLGHHHKFQKRHLFDESTRVPFILRVPWITNQHGKGTQHLTELVDLYPTLAELSNITPPDHLQGQSLLPLLKDTASSNWNKDSAFTITINNGESIKTKYWRLTRWGFGENGYELYDLRNDPNEFTNLANHPEFQSTVKQLTNKLESRRKEAGVESYLKRLAQFPLKSKDKKNE